MKRGPDEKEFYEALGGRLRIAREVKGVTQGHLAKKLGLTRTSVINMEQGHQGIQLHHLVKITEYLGVSFQLLLTGNSQRGRRQNNQRTT